VIAYIDSSVLTRAYLADEPGHDEARRLLVDRSIALMTGRFTRIEVSGALVRAERAWRHPSAPEAFATLDGDVAADGRVLEVEAPADHVEALALALAREHGLRTLDAWHVAVAAITVPRLADKGEPIGFASRDGDQATVAESLGFAAV
jgi:predicted nucleic acid-binding protein